MRDRSEHDPTTIREWSDHDPTQETQNCNPAAPPRLLFALARSRFYWKLQLFPLRLSFQISPHAAPATKSDTWTSPNAAPATKSDTWTSPNAAPATKSDTGTSPNAAPATKSESHDWSASHMKRHLQCAKQQAINRPTSPNTAPATQKEWQWLFLHHLWNVIYSARSNRNLPPTSPNTAPATPKECHDSSALHMKRHLQCAEQQASPSNLTKYCACHAKLHSQILEKFAENRWSGISNARPIRAWSEHDPSMIRPWSDPGNAKLQPAAPPEATFSRSPGADSIENYNFSRSGYHSKFHHMLRLPRKVTHELLLQMLLLLPGKVTTMNFYYKCCACHEKWLRRDYDWLLLLLLGLLLLGLLLLRLLLLGLLLLGLLLLGLLLLRTTTTRTTTTTTTRDYYCYDYYYYY